MVFTTVQRTAHRLLEGYARSGVHWTSNIAPTSSVRYRFLVHYELFSKIVALRFHTVKCSSSKSVSGPVNALGCRSSLLVPLRWYNLATTSSTLLWRCGRLLRRCTVFFTLGTWVMSLFRLTRPEF